MINDFVYLQKGKPLDCSKGNLRFILILGFYIDFTETMMTLVEVDLDQAKYVFEQRWDEYLQHTVDRTEGLPVYDKVDYLANEDALIGDFARKFGVVRDLLHDTWESFMNEGVPDPEIVNKKQVIGRLEEAHTLLLELYKSTQSK
jgi:hypothetical protein